MPSFKYFMAPRSGAMVNFARGEQSTPLSEGVHGTLNSKAHYGTRMTIFDMF